MSAIGSIFALVSFFGFIGVIYPTPLHKKLKIDKRWKALIVWLGAAAIAGPFMPQDKSQSTTEAAKPAPAVHTVQAASKKEQTPKPKPVTQKATASQETVEQKVRGNIATLTNTSPMELTLKDLEVNDYYGDGYKPGDKIVLITLHVGNTDWGGVETREELLKEVVPLFHRLFKIPQIAEVDVSFDVPGVDAYGNDTEIEGAMQINLKRETAKKMNFDYMEVYYDQFGKMADLYRVVPALQHN